MHVGGRKPSAVLAALALHSGQVVSVASLADALWPDGPPPSAVKSVQAYVSRLRKALRPEADIESVVGGYRLRLEDAVLDANEAERLAAAGRAALADGRPAAAIDAFREAAALWRGRPYEDLDDEAASYERVRLDELLRHITQERLRACLVAGDLDIAGELERLVAAHPLHEPFWGQLMVCLRRSGRQSDALRAYERLRQTLAAELGIEPGAELRALHAAILVDEEALLLTFPPLDGAAASAAVPAPPVSPEHGGPSPPVDDGPAGLWAVELDIGALLGDGGDGAGDGALADLVALVGEQVRAATAAHGGALIEARPLAWRSLFPDAASALRAAVAAAVAVHGGPESSVPLRGAVHAGTVTVVAGSYLGAVVRELDLLVGSVAAPGLLVSGAACDGGAGDGAGTGSTLVPDGPALAGGVVPFAVEHPDLPTTAPTGGRRAAARLPLELSSFVGRTAELEAIADLAERGRLVTLCGPGGIGKTRLSFRAAAEVASEVEEVLVVELAPVADGDLVAAAVAEALGAPESLDGSIVDGIVRHLGDRPTFVVLDNCEHVLAAAATVTRRLLEEVPRLRVLATSREPLGVPGELVVRVPPLAVPAGGAAVEALAAVESVQLLVDRAAAIRTDFRLDGTNADAVAHICDRLDGIPLAVELAAARFQHLSAREVADRLDDRFAVLVAPHGTRVERHRTLRAAIDWSHDLLSPQEQDLFARLAVFKGGWTLAAAEAVCAGSLGRDEVLDLLGALVRKSLVLAEDRGNHTRYRMLETIREYAAERLDRLPDAAAVRAGHFSWCSEIGRQGAARIGGPDETPWLERLDEERSNLVAAIRWSLDGGCPGAGADLVVTLKDYLRVRCLVHESLAWLEAALAADGLPARTRAKAQLALAETRFVCNHPEGWEGAAVAVELARPLGDRRLLVESLLEVGLHLRVAGRFAEAAPWVDEATEVARDAGDPHLVASALDRQGDLCYVDGRFEEAVRFLDEATQLFRRLGATRAVGWSLALTGQALAELGQFERARIVLEEALATQRAAGSPQAEAYCQNALGHLALDDGRLDDALGLFEQAIAAYRSWGGSSDLRWALHGVCHVLLARGEPEAARRMAAEAVSLALDQGALTSVAASLCHLAAVEAGTGRTAVAARLAGLAEALRVAAAGRFERVDRRRLDTATDLATAALGTDVYERRRREGEAAASTDVARLRAFVFDGEDPAMPAPAVEPVGAER